MGHGIWLPIVTPESRGLVALQGIPLAKPAQFTSPASGQIQCLAGYLPHTRSNPPSELAASSGSEVYDSSGISLTSSSSSGSGVGGQMQEKEPWGPFPQHLTSPRSGHSLPQWGGQDIGRAPAALCIALLWAFQIAQQSSEEPQPGQLFLPSSLLSSCGSPGNLSEKVFPLPQHFKTGWDNPPSVLL